MATLTCGLLPTIYYVYLYYSTISWQFYGVMATLLWLYLLLLPITAGPGRRLGRPGDRAAGDGRARSGRLPDNAGGLTPSLALTTDPSNPPP